MVEKDRKQLQLATYRKHAFASDREESTRGRRRNYSNSERPGPASIDYMEERRYSVGPVFETVLETARFSTPSRYLKFTKNLSMPIISRAHVYQDNKSRMFAVRAVGRKRCVFML